MSTTQKIFIGILVLVIIAIIIVVVNYYSKKAPDVATTTTYSQTSGLSAVGGIGGIGSLFAQLSDERFKTDISKISRTGYGDAYNQIKTISPVTYMYRDAAGMTDCNRGCKIDGVKKLGFIAQDLEKINPNLVVTDKNGIKYIDVMQVVALNTIAMKKMQEDLEYQKQLINSNPVYGGSGTRN